MPWARSLSSLGQVTAVVIVLNIRLSAAEKSWIGELKMVEMRLLPPFHAGFVTPA